MQFSRLICSALVVATLGLAPVSAPGAHHLTMVMAGPLEISGAFARAMVPGATTGGGYLSVTNTGREDDRLTGVSSPEAPMTRLHEMKIVNDVMVMREMEGGIVIPAGETVTLRPDGLHIMFMKVPVPFAEGARVEVTLTFERAGEVEIMLDVGSLAADSPAVQGPMDHSTTNSGN